MPFNDTDTDIRARLTEPFAGPHVFGTDPLGRDVLARLMYAGRISLSVGFAATALSVVVGVLVGLVAGFYRGAIGAVLMRFVDAMLCFPTIFLLLAVAALIEPSVTSIVVLIAVASWMEVARVVEGQIRSLRERDFALAAESLGASDSRIMFRELLAQRRRAHRGRRHAEHRARHPGRVVHQLPWLRHPAADAELGKHAGERAELPDQRALARDRAGAGHHADGHELQLHW